MNNNDDVSGIDDIRCFFIGALRRCKLPRPQRENYRDVAARCLGVPLAEIFRLERRGGSGRRNKLMGYHMAGFALRERGTLENLPSFAELICGFDFDKFTDYMAEHHTEATIAWWHDLQPPVERPPPVVGPPRRGVLH